MRCDTASRPTCSNAAPISHLGLVEAGLDDEAWDNLDSIEAVFRKLNAVDEAEMARRDLCG